MRHANKVEEFIWNLINRAEQHEFEEEQNGIQAEELAEE